MPIVNPSQSNPNDTIEAADINNPVNQLAAVINGNIDSSNLAANAVTDTQIASNGLKPTKGSNPCKFFVYRSAPQSITATTTSKIAFDTKVYDTGTNFDVVTNNRFTAPVAGFYLFNAAATIATGGGEPYVAALYVNGTEKYRTRVQSSGTDFVTAVLAPPAVQLALNDFVEVFFFNGSAGTKALQVGNAPYQVYFGGALMWAT